MLDRERLLPEWIKTGLSIILASVSAYWAIRVDLAMTIKEVQFLQATAARHEAQIEKLRDTTAAQASKAVEQARQQAWPGAGGLAGMR